MDNSKYLKHIDKIFDFSWGNTKFRQLFNKYYDLAFRSLANYDKDILDALVKNDFETLRNVVLQLDVIEKIVKHESTFAPDGLMFLTPTYLFGIEHENNAFSDWERNDPRNTPTNINTALNSRDKKINIMLDIGLIFINCDRCWELLEKSKTTPLTYDEIRELNQRGRSLADAGAELEKSIANTKKGRNGGNRKGIKRIRVQKILQNPKYNFKSPTPENWPTMLQQICNCYLSEYGKKLQTTTKTGKTTPTNDTIFGWVTITKLPLTNKI